MSFSSVPSAELRVDEGAGATVAVWVVIDLAVCCGGTLGVAGDAPVAVPLAGTDFDGGSMGPEGAAAAGVSDFAGDVLADAVAAMWERRTQRMPARTTTTAPMARILQGISTPEFPEKSFCGGRTCSARGSCRSGSSSTCTGVSDVDDFTAGLLGSTGRRLSRTAGRVGAGCSGSQTSCASICAWRRQAR